MIVKSNRGKPLQVKQKPTLRDNRIHRIKGQVDGIEKMMDKGKPCVEVVQQVLAAKNALSSLAVELLCNEACQLKTKEKQKELLEKIIKEV